MIILSALVGLSFQLLPNNSPHRTPRDSVAPTRVRIAATAAKPRIDGVLDDDVWHNAAPASGFVQAEPDEGHPATEATEVRIAYDDATLYIAAYMHDSNPRGIVVNDLRKDFEEQNQDDFEVLLDTFGDRRNGYIFLTNAAGAKADRQFANEGRELNTSWDAV
ncbi:MAG: carbohydrate binding family 9 domain-containing protein, partial [Gemmatimonadetes bacterium]|nr:carbohydrate binding family 9 domain-containing protein [Gemmatimonadota bacterium]